MTDRDRIIEMLERNKIEYKSWLYVKDIEISHWDTDSGTVFLFDKNNNLRKINE
jgi:hypothetical protein